MSPVIISEESNFLR